MISAGAGLGLRDKLSAPQRFLQSANEINALTRHPCQTLLALQILGGSR